MWHHIDRTVSFELDKRDDMGAYVYYVKFDIKHDYECALNVLTNVWKGRADITLEYDISKCSVFAGITGNASFKFDFTREN